MKKIPGYSNYSATRDGRVWTHNLRQGWMVPGIDKVGYIRYTIIGDNGKRKGMYAHQIIALTYIPNPQNKSEVNHLDHNKANNSVENLAWCTHLENIRHDWANKKRNPLRGEENKNSKVTEFQVLEIRRLYRMGKLQVDLSRIFGISQPTINQIVLNKTWKHI